MQVGVDDVVSCLGKEAIFPTTGIRGSPMPGGSMIRINGTGEYLRLPEEDASWYINGLAPTWALVTQR